MGRAVLCLGNVSMPEMADQAGAGCKAHSPAEAPATQLGQPPARAETCRMTLGTGTPELLAPRLGGFFLAWHKCLCCRVQGKKVETRLCVGLFGFLSL